MNENSKKKILSTILPLCTVQVKLSGAHGNLKSSIPSIDLPQKGEFFNKNGAKAQSRLLYRYPSHSAALANAGRRRLPPAKTTRPWLHQQGRASNSSISIPLLRLQPRHVVRLGPVTLPSGKIIGRRLLIGGVNRLPGVRTIGRNLGRRTSLKSRLIDGLTKDTDSGRKHSNYGVELHRAEAEAQT
jgi:hypothetical protein